MPISPWPKLPASRSSIWTLCWLASLSLASLAAQPPTIDPGYDHFYNNEFDAALTCFEAQLKASPDDPDSYNHVAQALLYRQMLRDGTLESQLVTGNNPFLKRPKMEISDADKQRILSLLAKSVQLGEAQRLQNSADVNALYALGVAHGLKSNYLFLVEKSWTDALREATEARKVSQQILALNPQEVDARLVIGLNHYVVGSLPFYMRALGFIGGFTGDRQGGLRDLEMVRLHGKRNRYDAEVLLAVLYRREKDPGKALPLLRDLAATFPRNYLFRLEQVQMYSDAGDKASALGALAEIEKLRADRSPGFSALPQGKLDYIKGNLLFWYGDLIPAQDNLLRATASASLLDLNTAVLAWLRLGQVHDCQGDHAAAVTAYREIQNIAPKSDVAVEAKRYMTNPYHRKKP